MAPGDSREFQDFCPRQRIGAVRSAPSAVRQTEQLLQIPHRSRPAPCIEPGQGTRIASHQVHCRRHEVARAAVRPSSNPPVQQPPVQQPSDRQRQSLSPQADSKPLGTELLGTELLGTEALARFNPAASTGAGSADPEVTAVQLQHRSTSYSCRRASIGSRRAAERAG